jgi:hypothetical protein
MPGDVYHADDQSKCTANDPLWYYSPDKTQIILCPNMCDKLAHDGGSVQVILGCPTKIPIIM